MKVELSSVSQARKRLQIEITPEEVAEAFDRTVRAARRQMKVPGFRPGKAPLEMVKARLGHDLGAHVAESLVEKYVGEAIRQQEVEPLPDAVFLDLEDGQKDPPSAQEGESYTFAVLVDVMPEVEPEGYAGLDIARPKAELAPEELQKEMEAIRQSFGRLVEAEDRPSAEGDYVEVEMGGQEVGGELAFEHKSQVVQLGAEDNLPAFDEHLKGLRKGEEFTFEVSYPEDFSGESLRGKTIAFSGTVSAVKKREVPELDDELAAQVADVEGLAELREKVESALQHRKEHEADGTAKRRLLDKLLDKHPFEAPPSLVEKELEHRLDSLGRNLASQGIDVRKAEIDWDKIVEEERKNAERSVREDHLLDMIALKEKLEVEPAELDQVIEQMAREAGRSAEDLRRHLKQHDTLKSLKQQVLRRKCLDWIYGRTNTV